MSLRKKNSQVVTLLVMLSISTASVVQVNILPWPQAIWNILPRLQHLIHSPWAAYKWFFQVRGRGPLYKCSVVHRVPCSLGPASHVGLTHIGGSANATTNAGGLSSACGDFWCWLNVHGAMLTQVVEWAWQRWWAGSSDLPTQPTPWSPSQWLVQRLWRTISQQGQRFPTSMSYCSSFLFSIHFRSLWDVPFPWNRVTAVNEVCF